jgi:hypothetical protein
MHESSAQLIGGALSAVCIARSHPYLVASGDKLAGRLEPQSPVCSCDE